MFKRNKKETKQTDTNTPQEPIKNLYVKRIATYWASIVVGYVFPLLYFIITAGIFREASKFVLPSLVAGIFLVIRLAIDIPKWVKTWRPSFWKGLMSGIPIILLFIILISLGLLLQHIIKQQIDIKFRIYFETVLVLFGSQTVSVIIRAFHIKYKQLDLIKKGYVMGSINNE